MKVSKYFNIDPNILIEYIYDESNLIGEPYNILYNINNGLKSFVSADEIRPPIRGFKKTNNDAYNQLYLIDNISNVYAKLPISNSASNKLDSDNFSFLQFRNFATSIPVRYDTIKVHIPINWTFGDYKGFYLRVFTYNFNNTEIVELSNFYFNITDIEQNYKLEYSSPILLINEQQWGKYVSVQIPAVTKISDQRRLNITRQNSINFNLTNGIGLSKNAPVFIDFHFIENIETLNKIDYFNLSSKISISVPQTPEFEKLGVKIEESKQGDFFLIYGTYNGTVADFENFIEDSYYEGNRYYVEYQIDLYEKNTKIKTCVFTITEDFGEEIEYRPILKFTTTTAIIDVTMKLIDNVDGTFIERKASYGLLQGGGAKMGSDYNPRLNIGIQNIGTGDISKYAKSLTKIELKRSRRQEVINIKSTISATTATDPFGTKPILKLKKMPFNLFSSNYYFIDSEQSYDFNNLIYIANNQSIVYLYPFDNIIKLKILDYSEFEELPYDLTKLENLRMVIKSDSKDINFEIYRDSAENDLENGIVIFRVSSGQYQSLKKVSNSGFNVFYIVGVDEDSIKKIIYSSYFIPWDTFSNINRLETNFVSSQTIETPIATTPITPVPESDIVIVEEEDIVPKGVNTTTVSTVSLKEINFSNLNIVKNGVSSSGGLNSALSFKFNPRWRADQEAILLSSSEKIKYKNILNIRKLEIKLVELGFINPPGLKNTIENIGRDGLSGLKGNSKIDYLLGYFKGLNINPDNNTLDKFFSNNNLKDDLNEYVNSGISNSKTKKGIGLKDTEVTIGEFLPKNKKDYNLILANKIIDQNPLSKISELKKRGGLSQETPQSDSNPQPAQNIFTSLPPFKRYRVFLSLFPRDLARKIGSGVTFNTLKEWNPSIRNNQSALAVGTIINLRLIKFNRNANGSFDGTISYVPLSNDAKNFIIEI